MKLFIKQFATFSLPLGSNSLPSPTRASTLKSINYHYNTFQKPHEFNRNFHSHEYLRQHKFCKIQTIKCHGTGFRLLIPDAEQYLFQSTQKFTLRYPGVRNAPQWLGNYSSWGVNEVKTKLHYNIYFCMRCA